MVVIALPKSSRTDSGVIQGQRGGTEPATTREDDDALIGLLCVALREAGYGVAVFPSPRAARAALSVPQGEHP